jgi:hypothetical protein
MWLLAVLGVGLGVALWMVHQPSVQRQIAERVLPRLQEVIGQEISVSQVRFGLFPLWLELRDVTLAGPGPGDPPVLVAERIFLQADISQIRRSRIRLHEVTAEGAEVYVERFADGLLNLPQRPPRETPRERRFEIDIGAVELIRGRFLLDEESVPLELSARGVGVELLGLGGTTLRGAVQVEEVEILLPGAHPYFASAAAIVELGPGSLVLKSGRVMAP